MNPTKTPTPAQLDSQNPLPLELASRPQPAADNKPTPGAPLKPPLMKDGMGGNPLPTT